MYLEGGKCDPQTLCSPDSQNPINLKINLFAKKMWKNVKQKSNQKKKANQNAKKCKKRKTEKTRIRLDSKLVKYYYSYYSYNCNPFWICRQSESY